MDKQLETIKDTFYATGFTDVRVNLWKDARIYVNLTPKMSFSYDLTQNYNISSPKLLPTKAFIVAQRVRKSIIDVQK